MSSCNFSADNAIPNTHDFNVIEKFEQLMQSSMGDASIYTRVKDTMKVQFDELSMTQEQKASMVSQILQSYLVQQSATAMQVALQWAKEETTVGYETMLLEAQAEKMNADKGVSEETVCKLQKETELVCAQITKTTGDNIRENGSPIYGPDGCTVISLDDTGLKYAQIIASEANSYATFAKTYREAGIVAIGTGLDGVRKATGGEGTNQSNNSTGGSAGLLNTNIMQTLRHTDAYDDTMRQYVSNSSGQLLGQLIASDTPIDTGEACISWGQYNEAISYLNQYKSLPPCTSTV